MTPRYGVIAEDFRRAIRNGIYHCGDRMPSLRGVCRQYRVSLGTAVEAYGRLQDEGWLEPRHRSGFFVSERAGEVFPQPHSAPQPVAAARVSLGAIARGMMDDARRPGIINLGAGVPAAGLLPLKTLGRAIASVTRKHPDAIAGYEPIAGQMELRRQIARLMGGAGVACEPEEVMITNGCLEALTLSLQAVTSPGDLIAIESPTFFGVLQVAEALGLGVVELPVSYPDGVTPASVSSVLAAHPIRACVLTPSCSNPTAAVMPDGAKQEIVKLLAQAGVPLIEDDIFGFHSFSSVRPRAARSYDPSGNTLLCSSFSKSLAPGLRLGWVMPGRYREQVHQRKFLANISTGTIPQLALADFLARGAFHRSMERMTTVLQLRAARMRADVAELFPQGTRMTNPGGGIFLWVELPDNLDSEVLYRKALQKGISILPGILFSPSGSHRNHIRLSYATVEPEISRAAIMELARLLVEAG